MLLRPRQAKIEGHKLHLACQHPAHLAAADVTQCAQGQAIDILVLVAHVLSFVAMNTAQRRGKSL